jgi:large subunit ribosomal protein L22
MSPDTDKSGKTGRRTGEETAELSLSSKLDRKRLRKAAHKRVVDLTAGTAHARYLRVTPMKARRVVNLVRGMKTAQAVTTLKFAPQRAALPARKCLESAVAGLIDKRDKAGLDTDRDSLYVAEVYVNEGPTMKRFLPRAKGRADRILKRTCHITFVVRQSEGAAGGAGSGKANSGRSGLVRRLGRGRAANQSATSKAPKKGRTR